MWVAYSVTYSSSHSNGGKRLDNFAEDLSLSDINTRVQDDGYEHSGYDRGHMAPSSLIDETQIANDQTFLMTNMTPQRPWFNRDVGNYKGVWGAIEDSVSCWLKEKLRSRIYVIAGVILGPDPEFINGGIAIPQGFYKVVLDLETMEAIGFSHPRPRTSKK